MGTRRLLLLTALAAACLASAATRAETVGDLEWAVSAGLFDVGRDQEATEAGLEARFRTFSLPLGDVRLPVEPAIGIMATDDEAVYGYLSLRVPLSQVVPGNWPERWRVVPYTGVGLYDDGDGKDLGGPVEFRSGLEVGYRVGERWWVGLNFYHLSNGVLYDRNPGAESLVLVVSWR